MQRLYVAGTMTECPLMRGVRLQEVSIYGGLTVYDYTYIVELSKFNKCLY